MLNYRAITPWASSDIETLATTWERAQIDALEKFDGFWSIIAADENKVYAVTDFLAKKPLYIHRPTSSVSSEFKALCGLPGQEYHIDELYFSSVAKWGYYVGSRTPYTEIYKIPPGTFFCFDLNTGECLDHGVYTSVSPKSPANLRNEIEKTVLNRMVSDVPVGLLLSGGLDSSIIYKLVERETHNFSVFHIENDEQEFFNALEIPEDIPVYHLSLDTFDESEVLYYNESPVDLGSMLSQYAIADAVNKTGLRVALSGDGADELFGGYRRITDYDSQYSDVFEELVFYHLPRLDKLMSSKTIELRCPFLSKPVIESALGLPYSERINKKYLKDLFADILPKEILNRKKQPLKSSAFKEGGLQRRYALIKKFREEVLNEYR
jgi:asparagine synthase (glutamine-hydrolysing)